MLFLSMLTGPIVSQLSKYPEFMIFREGCFKIHS